MFHRALRNTVGAGRPPISGPYGAPTADPAAKRREWAEEMTHHAASSGLRSAASHGLPSRWQSGQRTSYPPYQWRDHDAGLGSHRLGRAGGGGRRTSSYSSFRRCARALRLQAECSGPDQRPVRSSWPRSHDEPGGIGLTRTDAATPRCRIMWPVRLVRLSSELAFRRPWRRSAATNCSAPTPTGLRRQPAPSSLK